MFRSGAGSSSQSFGAQVSVAVVVGDMCMVLLLFGGFAS